MPWRTRCDGVGALVAGLLLLACGNSSGASSDTQLVAVGGDGQSAEVTSTLGPYQARVVDGDGNPVSGASVTWSVVSGGGSVTPTSVASDQDGIVSAVATLGSGAGGQVVRVSLGAHRPEVRFTSTGLAGPPSTLAVVAGADQSAGKGTRVPVDPTVLITDAHGNAVGGVGVSWAVTGGGGSVTGASTTTSSNGRASTGWTLGAAAGRQFLAVFSAGLGEDTLEATAVAPFVVLGGGGNVSERYSSDLWVAGGYGYTGTWGAARTNGGPPGNLVKIWRLNGTGAPVLSDSLKIPGVLNISDLAVSPDSQWLAVTTEGAPGQGLYVYHLTSPGHPVLAASTTPGAITMHTGSLAEIGGKLYAFTASDLTNLEIYDLSDAINGNITLASRTTVPPNYGIHDTYIRDGICFAFVWDEGVYLYDVGNGIAGGTPQAPVRLSTIRTDHGGAHNGWWFWNPATGEKRYLFVGEEGPLSLGTTSSGRIHVVDVSDLRQPVEVASYGLPGAGPHNFWMDESQARLYSAFYNGGVVALDVGGTLAGDLANRRLAVATPGSPRYVWGVMLYQGSLYASDMLNGFWQLGVP